MNQEPNNSKVTKEEARSKPITRREKMDCLDRFYLSQTPQALVLQEFKEGWFRIQVPLNRVYAVQELVMTFTERPTHNAYYLGYGQKTWQAKDLSGRKTWLLKSLVKFYKRRNEYTDEVKQEIRDVFVKYKDL